ncbi:MAG: right-handed parallel beta-helix repeat-containing protein [Planctomycetota bacterium]|jgi:predicted outer membrane repeat protein
MKLSLNSFCSVAALLILNSAAFATDRLVPSQYPTIQAAIGAADDNDIVIVAQGTYYENIDSGGKSITVISTDPNDPNVVETTVIDANGAGTVVTFGDNASAVCVLAGFTITDGNSSGNGGGILCLNGAITINNCIITGNSATRRGGGIASDMADLTLAGCTFSQNAAYEWGSRSAGGGGIFAWNGRLTVTDCQFSENVAINSGGGVRCIYRELALTDCTFSSNSAGQEGGGVATDYNSVTVTNCTFTGNSAQWGGGMNNSHVGATATNCLFSSNSADEGGGVCSYHLTGGDLSLRNCTFSKNVADNHGGAVYNRDEGNLTLTNCILWSNFADEGPQIAMNREGTLSISYSCLQGGDSDVYTTGAVLNWLSGNQTSDPQFADEIGGDYHLRSTAGRWDANAANWVTDDVNSPCIDAGDPCSDRTAELWPHGKCINMGAFGGTAQASMSQSNTGNIADLDHSDLVDGVDLKLVTDKWLRQEVLLSEDLDRDGLLDGNDFAVFADNWLWKQ